LRSLCGGHYTGDLIVFTRNEDRFLTVGSLQAEDATVLNAAPSDGHDDCEDAKAEKDRDEA
jgi:hypothetical protein